MIFLWNPKSGTADKERVKSLIEKKCIATLNLPEFHPTNAEGVYPELEKLIQQEKIKDIIAVGGDGTIRQVVAAFRHLPVRFGIIPMGSGNGLALAAGIPRNTHQAIDIVITGNYSPVDAFLINDHFSLMLSGIGFDAKVAHDFAKQKKRGLLTYAKVSLIHFFAARPYPFRIHLEGNTVETEAFFLSIANSNQFGNQFTIAPKASLSDGLLDIVAVKRMNRLRIVPAVLHQLRFGKPQQDLFHKNKILYYQVSRLVVENPELAPLHIDGDPFETSETFTIQCIPSAFQLIQP